MLRPKPGVRRPVDPIDRRLVEGVEAELPWNVLIQSVPCASAEAEERLLRLWRSGVLTGTPGALRPSFTRLAAVQAQPGLDAPAKPPHAPESVSSQHLSMPVPTAPVEGAALLRELRTLRGGTSRPAPETVPWRRSSNGARWPAAVRAAVDPLRSDAEAAMHTARSLLDAGDLKQAAYYARRAAQLAPDNISAHRVLLRFFHRSGMQASAQREREILQKLTRT